MNEVKKLMNGLVFSFLFAFLIPIVQAETYRVIGTEVAEEGTGLSWDSPMSLQSAISTAVDGDTILLKAGEYDITAQISLAKAITIKGGLAGSDDTTLDPSGKTTLNAFDRTTFSYIFNVSTAVADATNVFENICFTRAYKRAVNKSGRSHIAFRNCRFFRNGVRYLVGGNQNGGGVYLAGGTSSEAYFEDCLFDCNAHTNFSARSSSLSGAGFYANSMKRVYVDNCDFYSNSVQNVAFSQHGEVGQDGGDGGAAIWANAAPLTVRSSRFAANRAPGRDARGGTVRLTGNCGGSAFTNCLFVGNKTTHTAGTRTVCGSALCLNMDTSVRRVEVIDCTFAYNFSDSSSSASGLSVSKGTAYVRNSIFYGNHVNDSGHTAHYGRDVVVQSTGFIDIDYSLITGEGEYYISTSSESLLALGDHLVYGDPLFGTTLSAAKTAVNGTSGTANVASILAFDVHEGALDSGYSRAIDGSDPASPYANEPAPNGGVRNLGYYGNTAEAATSQTGVPVLTDSDVAITFADDTVPTVTATLGGSDMYNASVKIELAKTSGGAAAESRVVSSIQPGESVTLACIDLYEPGSTVYVTVTVTAVGQTPVVVETSATVTGTLPPYYGHGGGANVIHVRQGAKGRKDGTSWTDAFDSFTLAQKALAGDATKTEIWVAGKITESFAPSTVTIAAPLVIRGGFTGVEDSIDERPEGTLSTLDGARAYDLLTLANAAANPLAVERMIFTRARLNAFVNSGVGALAVTNCQFLDNSTRANNSSLDATGRGVNLSGAFTASFTSCVWRGNVKTGAGSSLAQGSAIYASGLSRLFLDDCLFVTNGMSATGGIAGSSPGRDRCNGDCLWMDGTPITARNCHFRGNRGGIRGDTGGVILLSGASGNSAFTNCTFVGNWGGWAESGIATSTMGKGGGALDIRLSTTGAKVDFEQCTLAYNLGDSRYCPGGLNIEKGTVSMHNSIIYGNKHGKNATVGHDIHVLPNGRLNLSYCRLTEEDGETAGKPSVIYVSEATEGLITYDNLTFGDPLFITSSADFQSNVKTSGDYTYMLNNTAGANFISSIDVHLRSAGGMFDNSGSFIDTELITSSAIDKGDPDSDFSNEPEPHGYRANLGAYGNTKEASMTPGGQPEIADVTITYPDDYTAAMFAIKIGGVGKYDATVTLIVNDKQYFTKTSCYNGETVIFRTDYFNPDETFSWSVSVRTEQSENRSQSGSATVPYQNTIPPWAGHGGGENVIHVWNHGYSSGDGSDWVDSVNTFDEALSLVTPTRNEIWIHIAENVLPETISLSHQYPVIIRGGFTGVEDAIGDRTFAEGINIEDAGNTNTTAISIVNANSVLIDGFAFKHGIERGLSKSGGGNLACVNCRFECNGASFRSSSQSVANGRGANLSGTSSTIIAFTNCVFAGNITAHDNAQARTGVGFGLYASDLKRLILNSTLFETNGVYLAGRTSSDSPGRDDFSASIIYATSVPVEARNCRFIGNRGTCREGRGGGIRLEGASGGSLFENCLFAGNYEGYGWYSYSGGNNNRAGALVVNLSTVDAVVAISNCTFAYNMVMNKSSGGALTVAKGVAKVANSIFFGNVKAPNSDAAAGADLTVVSGTGSADVSYSLFTADDISSYGNADTSAWEGCVFGDPLFVTLPATAQSWITGGDAFSRRYAETKISEIMAVNCHLRGARGYFDEKTGELVTEYKLVGVVSPAQDSGDRNSSYSNGPDCQQGWHGRRVNMGFYGNTPWATMTAYPGSVIRIR
jgi:hypothetical protein